MYQQVVVLGNLGRDPEVKSLPSGQPVANFSVATTRKWKDRDGNRKEETEWHSVVVYGKLAEIAGQYLTKGKQVLVVGHLKTRSWEKEGVKQSRTELIADNFTMLGGGERREETAPAAAADDDDIPFSFTGILPFLGSLLAIGIVFA